MERRYLFIFILFMSSVSSIARADTHVSGTFVTDNIWSKANSPYIVTGSVSVASGVSLTIEPGVIVKFDGPFYLYIDGTLKAIGTTSEEIKFTTNNAGQYWGYIYFRDSSVDATFNVDGSYIDGSILQNCIVEYAEGDDSSAGAIRTQGAGPFINFCTIQYNNCRGINYSGPINWPVTSRVTNCLIRKNLANQGAGIKIFPGHIFNTLLVNNNFIMENESTGDGGGIYASCCSINILNNIIMQNIAQRGGGIYIVGNCTGKSSMANNNIVYHNSATDGGGIYSTWANSLSNNTLILNISDTSSGMRSSSCQNVDYNLFYGNKTNSSIPSNTIGIINTNLSYNNFLNNFDTYSVRNLAATDCNFENNWWNTADPSQIDALIFDKLDDPTLGFVDYFPYAGGIYADVPISPPKNVQASLVSGNINLNWNQNPEPDAAGYKIYWSSTPGYPYEFSRDVSKVSSYTFLDLPPGTYYFAVTAYDNLYSLADDDPYTLVNDNQTSGHESWFSSDLKGTQIAQLTPSFLLLLED